MNAKKLLLALALPLALMILGGCAPSFQAKVARFQSMPVPEGQSFAIEASDPKKVGGLEFAQYAGLVSQKLAAKGYRPIEGGAAPALIVKLDYGVDNGKQVTVTRPSITPYGLWGRGYYPYSRFGGYYHGWDPYWGYPGLSTEVDSYTVYTSYLDLTISRSNDGGHVFEGKAKAHSTDDMLTRLVPNLVEAMFTGFPGNSGEDIKITVPPAKK